MRLFPPPLDIGETEGFTPEKDIFGRKSIGQGLTNLISTVSDPLVIAVDGQWGSGKTTFLKMWAGELRKAGFAVVYLDAFENDYTEDAFTALSSEIIALAQAKHKENTPAATTFVRKAVGAGKVLLRSGLGLGVKLATIGALDTTDFDKVADEAAKETGELFDKYVGELLTKQREQKEAIQSFREALAQLPALLTATPQAESSTVSKPLIIIVDELDRCRPLFALQVLERMKHFFAAPGVHFVLGTYLAQLRNSVMVAYGSNIDAETYLQKFIQLTVHLGHDSSYRYQRPAIRYIEHLKEIMQFKSDDSHIVELATDYFEHVSESRGLSLRQIEHIFSSLAIVLASKSKSSYFPHVIVAGLCALKILEPDLYVKAKKGELVWDEAMRALAFTYPVDEELRQRINGMGEYWQFATAPIGNDHPLVLKNKASLDGSGLERQQIVPFVANSIMDRLAPFQ